jgi:exportin-7
LDSISRQRKIATNFRDTYLCTIFVAALDVIRKCIVLKPLIHTTPQSDISVACATQAIDLTLTCLSFDFIGSLNDETLDENVNIQVPTKWKPILIEKDVITLFFSAYIALPAKNAAKIFQNVVQLTSVRRMLFDTSDRQKYLSAIVVGIKNVLENDAKLNDTDNFHHFCRIISRLKANYQVSELLNVPEFSALLHNLNNFTLSSLRMSENFSQNSIYYLISFWSRIAGSLSYAKADTKTLS